MGATLREGPRKPVEMAALNFAVQGAGKTLKFANGGRHLVLLHQTGRL